MKKLQSKIILSMVICSLIVSLITSVVGVINSTNMVESQVKENLITVTSNISAKLQAELGKMESGTVAMASVGEKLEKDKISDSDYYREFSNRVEYFISATSKNLKNISSIYFQINPQLTPGSVRNIEYKYNLKNQKFMRQYSKTQSADSFNRENEKLLWYFDAVDSKSGTWGDLVYDYGLEKNIITYSTPIYNDENLVGVLGIDVPFEVFEKFIADSNTSNNKGFSFLLDSEKNILIHDSLDVGSSIDDFEDNRYEELSKNIDENNLEVFTVDTPENIYYSTFEKLPNGWTLVTFSYYDDIMSFSFDLISQFTVVGLVSLAITIFIAFILGKFITNPIKKLTNLINITTDLDLKNDSSYDYMLKYKDEVGTMVKAIAEMRSTLRSMVSDLSQNSSDVLNYSKELMQSIDTNSRSMDEVRNAMKEIASGSSDQANKAQSGKETVDTFSEKMISTASRAELLGKSSNDTLEANEEGKQAMVSLREKFKENTIIVNEVGHSVENLEHASDRIETIIKTIVDIAEQTNLLALNAAIEAARAGEHGRGFAVVSDEIRALAEQTSKSTKEIHSIVNGIKENITQTKSKTYEAEEINSTTNSVLESTSDIFDKINDNMNETIQEISGIIDSIYHVNSEKDAISTSMEDILFVSEETAASSEEVFASVEEQARSIEHIADASNELENLSKKLKSIVDKFDI